MVHLIKSMNLLFADDLIVFLTPTMINEVLAYLVDSVIFLTLFFLIHIKF